MSDETYKYTQATVTIQNTMPGQSIGVELVLASSESDDQVNWSTGQPMPSSSTGIQLTTTSGVAVLVNSLSVNGTMIDVQISNNGSDSMTFSVSASLVAAAALQYVSIKSTSDPGPVVSFQFSDQRAIVLSQTPVAIKWPL